MIDMPRFFAEPENIRDNIITLYGDDAGHISRVLRCSQGEILSVCDGTGMDYEARIIGLSEKEVKLEIINSVFTITLYQGITK